MANRIFPARGPAVAVTPLPAAGWQRYKLTCEGRELINVNSVQGVLGGETDDTIYNEYFTAN